MKVYAHVNRISEINTSQLSNAGINNILCETIDPHPKSFIGSENSEEETLRELCKNHNIVAGIATNKIATNMIKIDNSIFKCPLSVLYPTTTGRSMDIWNPYIVDTLELFHRSVLGKGRKIGGLWLTLGGPTLWCETNNEKERNGIYHIETQAAREALGRDTNIDMNIPIEGRHYAPVIVSRLGRIAYDLVMRLKNDCSDFYFYTYTISPSLWKPIYQAAGMPGMARELCESLSDIKGVNIHLICSHSHECSAQSSEEGQKLQRRFSNIEFISGVGGESKLRTVGAGQLCEGYRAIEVKMNTEKEWSDLPYAMSYLNKLWKIL